MHGCGVKLIPKGNGEIVPQEGEWLQDAYVGDVMACSKYASRKKAMEADAAALEARKLKPRDVGGEKSGGKKFSDSSEPSRVHFLPSSVLSLGCSVSLFRCCLAEGSP